MHELQPAKQGGIQNTVNRGKTVNRPEIAENLHRADLTQLQRKEQVALWIKLTNEKNSNGRTPAIIPNAPGQPEGGLRAAARELGVKRIPLNDFASAPHVALWGGSRRYRH